MSHKATNWAIQQRGIDPAAKILLWHLADCHNSHTGRCDPSQERLAHECEMSRSTVNRHMKNLEAVGLIRRVKRYDDEKKKRSTTFYELALDRPFPMSQSDTKPMCQNDTDLCVKTPQNQCPTGDTLTCKGTGKEPVNAQAHDLFSDNPEPEQQPDETELQFERFWKAYPKKAGKPAAKKAFLKAIKRAPADLIIQRSKAYADLLEAPCARGEFKPHAKHPQGWLNDDRWEDDALRQNADDPEAKRYRDIAKKYGGGA